REIAADHVVERAVTWMTLDILEQERRAALAAHKIGDGRRLQIGIDLRRDALELAERLDLFQPGVEIAAVGTARRALDVRLAAGTASTCTDRDAHVHARPPCWLDASRTARKCSRAGQLRNKKPGRWPGHACRAFCGQSEARHRPFQSKKVGERLELSPL